MAHVKTTSYIDAVANEVRADNLTDLKAALNVIEAENNLTFESIAKMHRRIQEIEANMAVDYRQLSHRIEKLEHKGKPEGRGVGDDK